LSELAPPTPSELREPAALGLGLPGVARRPKPGQAPRWVDRHRSSVEGAERPARSPSQVASHQRFDYGLRTLRAIWARWRVLRLTRPCNGLLVAIAMRCESSVATSCL